MRHKRSDTQHAHSKPKAGFEWGTEHPNLIFRLDLEAGELGDVGGGDFGLEDWGVSPDVADLAGCDFILGDFAGLAGTGIYQGLRTGLELACAACGDHYVAKIAIELLLDTH